MLNSRNDKSFVCFVNGSQYNTYFLTALAFYPDKNFEFAFMPESPLYDNEISYAKVIKSCINDDQTKALVCYTLENNEKDVKCFYYNSQQNKLSKIFINVNYCNTNIYGFNIFFFQQTNEYIFSCFDSSKENFSMRRLDINCNVIDDDNNILKRRFSDCDQYDFFSIIYISNYNVYSGIFNSNCMSGIYIKIFMLSDRICISKNEKDENTISTYPETIIVKTTLPILETTIPPTKTTMPEVKITNVPTNEQQITTNSLKVESPVIDTIIQNN